MGRPRIRSDEERKILGRESSRQWRRKYPARYLVHVAKGRAARTGREFNLTEGDIFIPDLCPILGIQLNFDDPTRNESPSLDRIDNSRGYTKDNVRVISNKANKMKGDASDAELRTFARWVIEQLPKQQITGDNP